MGALIKKEIRAYFMSAMGYALPTVFLFLAGLAFTFMVYQATQEFMTGQQFNASDQIIRPLYGNFMRFLCLIFLPFITMGKFAEEKRTGTLELLFTYPVTDWQLLFSKMVGCFCLLFMVLVPMLLYPILLHTMGGIQIEWSVLATGYLGTFLLCLAFISMGLWASSITDNQVVAVAVTIGLALVFWLIGVVQSFTTNYELGQVFTKLSLLEHFDSFYRGIIDSTDVIYYVTFSAFFIFLTLKALESRKWRG
ncbi:MAG TPA: ABC transporter permease subunit [Candidatus Xenobia bacterium]